ncbi:MAG TPA: RsmG family class I SAM-dependent methyltransferase [Thermoanaerobaculaceae bacterium]|nr:RsmG family class I SAM-dependent methyltransferase [Thermoanaerobaculaceae bacterium]
MSREAPRRQEWRALLLGAGFPSDAGDRMTSFLSLLVQWGRATDLFGGAEPETLLDGLVHDTLAALPWVATSGSLLDVGSGNGFPAVPLLVARPGLHGVLLEPRERRWAFLKEVVRELGLDAEARRERVADHPGSGYLLGTVRGLDVDAWLPDAGRLVGAGGSWLWWTSRAKTAALRRRVLDGRVLTFPLPGSAHGELAIWQRCST